MAESPEQSLDVALGTALGDSEASTPQPAPETATTTDSASAAATNPEPAGAGQQPQEEEWSDEEHANTPSDETGKNRIVAKNRFDSLYRVYKQAKELESIVGHLPSTEEAQQMVAVVADYELMQADLLSGDPQRAARFAQHWLDVAGEAQPVVVAGVLDTIREANPSLYGAIQSGMATEALQSVYSRVAGMRESDPSQFAKALYAVQMVDWMLRGDYLEANDLQSLNAPEVDPTEVRLRELEAREAKRLAEQRQAADAMFETRLTNHLASVRDTEVERALSSVASAFSGREKTFSAIREALVRAAFQDLEGDTIFNARFAAARDRAMLTGDEKDVQAASKLFSERFSRALRQRREGIVREVTGQLAEQSKATHSTLQRSAGRMEPRGGSGAAAPVTGERFREAVSKRNFDEAFAALGLD